MKTYRLYKCCILAVPLHTQLHALKNVVFPLRTSLRVLATEPLCLSDSASCQQTGGIYYPTCWQRIADSRTAVWDCIVRTFFFMFESFYSLKSFFIAKCHWFGLQTADGLQTQVHPLFIFVPLLPSLEVLV